MENNYKIKYLSLFYKDLDKITDYIKYKLNNDIAADNLIDTIEIIGFKEDKNENSIYGNARLC